MHFVTSSLLILGHLTAMIRYGVRATNCIVYGVYCILLSNCIVNYDLFHRTDEGNASVYGSFSFLSIFSILKLFYYSRVDHALSLQRIHGTVTEEPHCVDCELYFSRVSLFNRHNHEKHAMEPEFYCESCDKYFDGD